MIIGGLQKLSLLDYPNLLSAIVFTKGCNFRCHYCYNPDFVRPDNEVKNCQTKAQPALSEAELLAFLTSRLGKLDAVVISGGEPTLHADLPEFIKKIKDLGYLVKLDTNGTNPDMLRRLIADGLLDYIAMDAKAPFSGYFSVVNMTVDCQKIKDSAIIVMNSGLPYEFRTTVHRDLLSAEDIFLLAKDLQGASKWFLQNFVGEADLLNANLAKNGAYTKQELETIALRASEIAGTCRVRNY